MDNIKTGVVLAASQKPKSSEQLLVSIVWSDNTKSTEVLSTKTNDNTCNLVGCYVTKDHRGTWLIG